MHRDSFSIDLILRHTSRSTRSIAKALFLKPQIAYSNPRSRRTYFQAVLQNGNSPAKFQLALPKIVRFLCKNKKFWKDFIAENGSAEVVFNYAIFPQTANGDKSFELCLTSVFCEYLAANGVGLKIQGWQRGLHPKRLRRTT